MNQFEKTLVVLAAVAAVAGCGTIRAAREAQKGVAARSAGAETAERIAPDFAGAPLRALVEYAHVHRPSMTAAALAVRDARLAMKEIAADAPLASATPWNAASLNATLGYSERSDAAHLEDLKAKTRTGKATGTLSLDLLIYDFGRNAARARAQAEAVVSAEQRLLQEGYTVFDEVASAYFAWLRDDALLTVARTNEQSCAAHLEQAESRFTLGEAMELDVLRAKLDLASARENLVSASNAVVTAGAELMSAMGIDAALGDAASVLGARSVALDRLERDFPDTGRTAGEAYAVGCTNAPALAIARAKLRGASAQVDYAVADLMPSVKASLGLTWTDPLWYWNWGVSAVQSLFTGFRKTTAVDRAVVAMESAATDVAREELALSQSLELAVAERDNAREALAAARTRLAQAQENLDAVSARYAVGEASRVDFTDAVSAWTEALGSRIKAFYRGQTAEARLFRLLGEEPDYHEELTTEEMCRVTR